MKEISPIAGIDCKKHYDKISHAEGTDHQVLQKYYEREYYTFQDHRNRRKYKESYKDRYREENHKYKRRSRIIMKMSMKTDTIGMNMNTNT